MSQENQSQEESKPSYVFNKDAFIDRPKVSISNIERLTVKEN